VLNQAAELKQLYSEMVIAHPVLIMKWFLKTEKDATCHGAVGKLLNKTVFVV